MCRTWSRQALLTKLWHLKHDAEFAGFAAVSAKLNGRSSSGAYAEPCGPDGPVPPAPTPLSLLWQSPHVIWLANVHGCFKLGTFGLRPDNTTGWNEFCPLASENSSRVLSCGDWRLTRAGPFAVSPWQRKHNSYS